MNLTKWKALPYIVVLVGSSIIDTLFMVETAMAETTPTQPSQLILSYVNATNVLLFSDAELTDNEDGFHVLRSKNGSSYELLATLPANASNYVDSDDIAPGNEYCYHVTAFNSAGESPFAEKCIIDTFTPWNLTARYRTADAVMRLTWQDYSGGVNSFFVYRSANGSSYSQIAARNSGDLSYDDAGVTADSTYCYKIQSTDGVGFSSFSNEACAVAEDTRTLGEKAADLAVELANENYLWGGKGWDFVDQEFVSGAAVKSAYNYWNPDANNLKGAVDIGSGVDCSGLIAWSYNRSNDASQSFADNVIKYEGADGQYLYNTVPITEAELQPGDVMFFDFDDDGRIDHVAEYVGDQGSFDVVQARTVIDGIDPAVKNDLKVQPGFVAFARPQSATIAMAVTKHSPVSLTVTDPDGVSIDGTTVIPSEEEYLRESGNLYYRTIGIDAEGYPVDTVYSPVLKEGAYKITVAPLPSTTPDQTYSLEFMAHGQTISLANNVPLGQIPADGYDVTVAPDGSVTFDTTPPEARIAFSQRAETIIVMGVDDSNTTVSTNATSTIISDSTGNTLSLDILKDINRPHYAALIIPSFAYSSGVTTSATTSLRYFWATNRKGAYTLFISAIRTPTERLLAVYIASVDKTYLIESRPEDDDTDLSTQLPRLLLRHKVKTYGGIVIPAVTTDKGNVSIEYAQP